MILKLQRINALFLRGFYSDKRNSQRMTDYCFWPLLDIALWAVSSFWLCSGTKSQETINAMVTCVVLWETVLRAILDIAVSLIEELWAHNLVNLFTTPLTLGEWMVATMMGSVVRISFVFFLSAIFTWLAFGVPVLSLGFMLIPYLTLIAITSWSIGFLAASVLVTWGHRVQTVPWVAAWLFAPVAAVYYPLSALPLSLQKVSAFTPFSYTFEAIRNHMSNGLISYDLLAKAALLATIYFVCSSFILHKVFQRSLRAGLASLD